MDPRIASGFSILGNALMPDPSRLAQAEVYRSQMLENQANAGKLGAERDALVNAARNMQLLQDVLSNPNSSAEDILSRGVGAGIAADPSQLPKFALGALGMRGFDINDPSVFSKALLATGQVANQAATPEGFAADQARQAAQAAATDATTRRGDDFEHSDRRYATDVGAATSIETQRMEDLRQIAITTADRNLLAAVEKAKLAKDYYDIHIDSNDAAQRLGVESQWNQAKLALDAAIAQNRDATALTQTGMEVQGAEDRNRATITSALTMNTEDAASAADVANIQADASRDVARIGQGVGGGPGGKYTGWAGLEFTERAAIAQDVVERLATRYRPEADWTDNATRNGYLPKLVPPALLDTAIKSAADILGSKNTVGIAELVSEMLRYKENNDGSMFSDPTGEWVIDTTAVDLAKSEMNDLDTPAPAPAPAPVAPAQTVPAGPVGTGEPDPGTKVGTDNRTGRKVYSQGGTWYYVDDNALVPGQ